MWRGPTYRTVDGERIDGAWCRVWRWSEWADEYLAEDLIVYADGGIRCPEQTDLAGLEELLGSRHAIVTRPGTPEPPEEPSKWLSRQSEPLTPEGFLSEVADRIEELAGRPTAAERCWDAIERYRQEPDETNRALLRTAYLAVPPHRRVYVLGDTDRQDRPLRILATEVGEAVDGDGPVVTPALHAEALGYFRQVAENVDRAREARAIRYADDPTEVGRTVFVSHESVHPQGPPTQPGPFMLRTDCPAEFVFGGERYASVLHGYWALSAADAEDRRRIREAQSAREARELGGRAGRRADWPAVRLAVMGGLLRARFAQHPEAAEVLLATGDARISYTGISDAPFWRDGPDGPDGSGRNWIGRLLELVRAELAAEGTSAG